MTLQLEVGKYYRARNGDKVGPLARTGVEMFPFIGSNHKSWDNQGRTWANDRQFSSDLIEEWKDEELVEHRTFEETSAASIETVKLNDTASILAERQKTHGDFTDNARVMQKLKECVMTEPGWDKLSLVQREALQMILHKCGRIISGNPNEPDHWLDIAGYATLAKDRVES